MYYGVGGIIKNFFTVYAVAYWFFSSNEGTSNRLLSLLNKNLSTTNPQKAWV